MSEKLCALRKIGGGTLKETTLWTNPNPTSTMVAQNITLENSEKFSNYKFIKLVGKWATNNNKSLCVIYPYETFIKTNWSNWDNTMTTLGALMSLNGSAITNCYMRTFSYLDDTSMRWSGAVPLSNISGGIDNTKCIPLNVIGMS